MKYQIFYTDSAKQDLKNIYRYICDSLVEPEIAEKLTDKIMKKCHSGIGCLMKNRGAAVD